jgi:uncharacterized membrane protein YraQ (UPF0718 family)
VFQDRTSCNTDWISLQTEPVPTPPTGFKRKKRKPFDVSLLGIGALMSACAATVYFRDGQERFLQILYGDLSLFGGMLVKMMAGCLVGAFIARLLSRELVARWVGTESGFTGLFIATVVGAFLPGGPVTIFPIAAAFVTIGADVGATIAFITSWTMMGFTRALVWEIPFFGLEFTLWRTLESIPLPIIAGLLGRVLAIYATKRWGPAP